MNKRTEEWKKYVREAKTRLNLSKFQPESDEIFYLNSEKLSRSELARLNGSIAEILASDDFVYNPLGKMIDEKVYDALSEEAKDKYIFDLSSIYLTLRSKFKK